MVVVVLVVQAVLSLAQVLKVVLVVQMVHNTQEVVGVVLAVLEDRVDMHLRCLLLEAQVVATVVD
jgi:hypothetical protein